MKEKGRIFVWSLFDFANTAFSVIIVTVVFSKYFSNYVAYGNHSLWGIAVSISMIAAALLSPPLGAIADFSRNRKRFLLLFTLISIICTALMFFVKQGDVLLGFTLFVLANIGFEGGLVFYDAFLPNITEKKNYGRVSGYGFAMGYLGALAILLIAMAVLPSSTSPNYYFYVRLMFAIAALFFLIFAAPIFLFIKEPESGEYTRVSLLKKGMSRSAHTFKSIFIKKEYPAIARFLIAFFIYNDAIITIIAFAAIFMSNVLKMSDNEIILFFVVMQSSAILGSVVFGIIADHIGPKNTIGITLVIWIAVVVGAFFVNSVSQFYVVGLLAGVSIGSSQSSSRSLMALLTPKEREAEFFGFYDGLCGKASAIIGPFIYGMISDLSNDRFACLAMGAFFLIGLILLRNVRVDKNNSQIVT
jgi:MFS transporter, UMF1 family